MKEYSWSRLKGKLLSIVLFLIVWEFTATLIDNDIYLPRVVAIVENIVIFIKDKDFWINIVSTLNRTIISFVVALILAITSGIISIISPIFEELMKPFNSIGKTIPTMILVLLALIWFDKNIAPFIVGIGIAFPIIYEGIINSIKGMDTSLKEMLVIYEVSKIDKIKRVYIPIIKNHLVTILVSTFSLVFKVVVAGEVHGQPQYGIGAAVQIEKVNFNTTGIFSWIIIIAIVSIAFDIFNNQVKRRVNRWKK